MGALSRNERWLAAILAAVMTGWISSPWHPIPNTFVALGGLCAMIITGVLQWDDVLGERRAWDALLWFAPLLMMADELTKTGVIAVAVEAGVRAHPRLALGGGAADLDRDLPVHPLWIREHDRAHHGAVSRVL